MPTKILRVTCRKSPCGEGTNTWDRYEMRIHKRVIDIHCPSSVVKDITTFKIDSSVDVGLIVWKQWERFLTWFFVISTAFRAALLKTYCLNPCLPQMHLLWVQQGCTWSTDSSVNISQSMLKWIYIIKSINS